MKKFLLILSLLLLVSTVSGFGTELNRPESSYVHNTTEDLSVEWTSINDQDYDRNRSTYVVVSDGEGNEVEEKILNSDNVSAKSESTELVSISPGTLSPLSSEVSEWEIIVRDEWEQTEDSYENTVPSESTEDFGSFDMAQEEVEQEAGAYEQNVLSPTEDYIQTEGDSLTVEWDSTHNFSQSKSLESSNVTVYDQDGSEYSEDIGRSTSVNSGATESETVEISSSTLEDFTYSGEWAVRVVDNWNDKSIETFVYFNSEQNTTSDDSGSTDEDSSGVIVDDSTDGSDNTSDGSDNSSDEDTSDSEGTGDDSSDEDTSDSSDSDGGDSQDSSDGSTGDSDGGNEDDSTDTSDSSDSGDDSSGSSSGEDSDTGGQDDSETRSDSPVSGVNSVLEREVAGGLTAQTVLLALAAVLVVVILFWRSSYQLAF